MKSSRAPKRCCLTSFKNYPPSPGRPKPGRKQRYRGVYVPARSMCCAARQRSPRHIRFDTAAFTIIFRSLLDLSKGCEPDDFYKPASLGGLSAGCSADRPRPRVARKRSMATDCLLRALTDLKGFNLRPVLRQTVFGTRALFSDHCALLALLRTMIGRSRQIRRSCYRAFRSLQLKR